MADEEATNNEGIGFNRRNFLKSAGVVVAGGTLGAGLTVAEQMIAEKLGMDIIDVAMENIHASSSQKDPTIPISLKLCVEAGKEAMNWQWHPAGIKKLPDGRMHGQKNKSVQIRD